MDRQEPDLEPNGALDGEDGDDADAPARSSYLAPRALRPVIALSLLAGPAVFAHGVSTTGRWPEGIEWIQTVLLVPLISIGAGAIVVGAAFMAAVLIRLIRG